MKGNSLSRLELLNWLNEATQCDYPRVESCCDGVGYCQIIDSIHPGVINLSKLNFNAKFPDEYSLNLKILDDTFKKLKIEKLVQVDKLSKGKFQDNINFLQWIYNYAAKCGPLETGIYNGYQKRLEALQKQKHNNQKTMSTHLTPSQVLIGMQRQQMHGQQQQRQQQHQQLQYYQQQNILQNEYDEHHDYDENLEEHNINYDSQQNNMNYQQQQQQQQYMQPQQQINQNQMQMQTNQQDDKIQQYKEFVESLEEDLKGKMEYNWKILYALDDMIYQRNTLFDILRNIEMLSGNYENSQTQNTILQILANSPADFLPQQDQEN